MQLVHFILVVTLISVNLVNARPHKKTTSITSYQNSSVDDDRNATNGKHRADTNSRNHFISKRQGPNAKSGCNPRTDSQAMQAPIIFVKLNGKELGGLSFGTPEVQPYEVCVFDGCTAEEIQTFKQNNKRNEVAFHYNALPDIPGGKPSFKLTYTKFFTQCEADKSSQAIPESGKEDKFSISLD